MRIKLILFIFFLAVLLQPVLAIDTNAKNATLQMTTTLENSNTSLQWNYAKNIGDGRGITFGAIGFCTGTYDGNILIKYYTTLNPDNKLAKYIPALNTIDTSPHNAAGEDGNPSVAGLTNFIRDVQNCNDPLFKQAQLYELNQLYYNPAVTMFYRIGAKNSLTLAFIYDMSVRHGVSGAQSIIDKATSALGGAPKTGVDENTYLSRMITLRDAQLKRENLNDVDRDAGYKVLLASGNVKLDTPFTFTAYSDSFTITGDLGVAVNTTPTLTSTAEFTTSITSGYAPLSVQFTDCSQNADLWNWNFGDGTNSTEHNPTHTYSEAGTYTVNLTVSNLHGNTSKTATITVQSQSSSSRGGSSSGNNGGVIGSPEPQSNVETKELSHAFITNGNLVKFNFPQNSTSVVYVSFDSKKTAGKTTTIAEILKEKSTLVSGLPSGEVYKSLNIWVGNSGFATPNNIENAVVCFKVEKSWIKDNGIDQSSITLNRYSDKKWDQLQISLLREDDKYLYFTAKTPGFSSFAITSKIAAKETVTEKQFKPNTQDLEQNSTGANVEQTPEQKENTSIPGKESKSTSGFEIVCSVVSLLGVFLYKRG